MFYGGLTYSSHPVSLRRGARDDRASTRRTASSSNAARLGGSCAATTSALAAKHPSVGADRNLGLFGILDLVREPRPVDADDAVQRHVATR